MTHTRCLRTPSVAEVKPQEGVGLVVGWGGVCMGVETG